MRYHVLTLFPEMVEQGLHTSILERAMKKGILSLETTNIRDFSVNKFKRVDDYPYGGGAGMVIEAEPVYRAYCSVAERMGKKPRTIYLTPQGRVLNQTMAEEFAMEDDLVLICGHYEGIDDRVLQEVVTDYVSIGDYVLTGGELGAMVLIDAVSRFVPGVLGNEESSQFESLQDNLLEYPHYTRPEMWHDIRVPEVLLSGNHEKIEAWRHEESIRRTKERRPDLLEHARRVYCAVEEHTKGAKAAHLLTDSISRYGTYLDLGRKKIRKQGKKFGSSDLLILSLPKQGEEGCAVECLPDTLSGFSGNHTPVVLMTHGEQQIPEVKEILAQKGFFLFMEIQGDLSEEERKHAALVIRDQIYTGRFEMKKILASGEGL